MIFKYVGALLPRCCHEFQGQAGVQVVRIRTDAVTICLVEFPPRCFGAEISFRDFCQRIARLDHVIRHFCDGGVTPGRGADRGQGDHLARL